MVNYDRKNDPFWSFRPPDDRLPWLINLLITNQCNLFCPMCQCESSGLETAAPAQVMDFLDKLAKWLTPPRQVLITGGEPLLHPTLVHFVEKLSALGYLPALNTNGGALTTKIISALDAGGLHAINFSLDGVGPSHNRMRNGPPGLYQHLLDMIQFIASYTKIEIYITSVISASNAPFLPELVRMVDQHPGIISMRFQAVVPVLSQKWSAEFFRTNPLWPLTEPDSKMLFKVLDELKRLATTGSKIVNPASQFALWRRYFTDPEHFLDNEVCRVAERSFQMEADGKITLCNHQGELGTILDDPKTLWESTRADKIRKKMSRCVRPCNYFVNCCYLED